MSQAHIAEVGTVTIRAVPFDHPLPDSPNPWSDWGEKDPEAMTLTIERWLVELTDEAGTTTAVGDLSAHSVWYGASPGSRAINIGISVVEEFRGRGIGSVAQRLLAEELHRRGVVRVEASTDVENIAEQRSLERAGFAYEGTLRLAQGRADGLHDLQVWAHVRHTDPPDG